VYWPVQGGEPSSKLLSCPTSERHSQWLGFTETLWDSGNHRADRTEVNHPPNVFDSVCTLLQ
ncbi:hypothetical protein KIPB_013605, partial [Kipferlia bialata]